MKNEELSEAARLVHWPSLLHSDFLLLTSFRAQDLRGIGVQRAQHGGQGGKQSGD